MLRDRSLNPYTPPVSWLADDEGCNGCFQGIMEVDRKRRALDYLSTSEENASAF
jgi:hypothetical protein